MTRVTAPSFATAQKRLRGGVLIGQSEVLVFAYYCPVCGIPLEQTDFDKPEDDYYCPLCGSRRTPSQMPGLAGWEPPY
jgi:hypothetical protein